MVKLFIQAKAAGAVTVTAEGGWGVTNTTEVQVNVGETTAVRKTPFQKPFQHL
jgi:hypothetical protein